MMADYKNKREGGVVGDVLSFMPKEVTAWQRKWSFLQKNPKIEITLGQMHTYKWHIGRYIVYYDLDRNADMSRMTVWRKGDLKPLGDTLSVSEKREDCIKSSHFLLKCFENLLNMAEG